ncbi:cardiolipin synthase [Treponema sp.]|uniref:cardiolipin synthase n=1 Tax=Treponema sp. TaxID=166 RepID=UPI003F0C4B3C
MKKRIKLIKRFIYSRVAFCFLLLAMQIFMYLFFIIRFSPYIFYLAGVNLSMSFMFMAYLSNCDGKNEFKFAWLLPTMIFPLFGISLYIYTKMATGNSRMKNKIRLAEQNTLQEISTAEKNSGSSEIPGLSFYLRKNGNFPAYTDSSVEYFPCGEKFFADFIGELKKAEKFIFLEFFIITPDSSWKEILAVLKEKAHSGVEVRVLCDGIGSLMASSNEYQKYLNLTGISSRIYMPLAPVFNLQQNNRDHRKIAVIDGKTAYTGGLNLADEYFNRGQNKFCYWKDSAVKIRGNAVKTYTALFLQMWSLAKSRKKKQSESYKKFFPEAENFSSGENILIPYADNAYNEKDIAENIYLHILSRAEKNICITTPYIIIDNQLKSALIFAANRGINVSLIVPSRPDHFLAFCIGKTFLKTLVENGVHVYLYLPGFIHSKIFASDGKIATVGSVNLDYRSLFHHFEAGLLIYRHPVVKEIQRDFEITKLSCKEMKIEDYKKLPLTIRITGRIFRIFAPLL